MKVDDRIRGKWMRGWDRPLALLEPIPSWFRWSYGILKVGGIMAFWLEGKFLGLW